MGINEVKCVCSLLGKIDKMVDKINCVVNTDLLNGYIIIWSFVEQLLINSLVVRDIQIDHNFYP